MTEVAPSAFQAPPPAKLGEGSICTIPLITTLSQLVAGAVRKSDGCRYTSHAVAQWDNFMRFSVLAVLFWVLACFPASAEGVGLQSLLAQNKDAIDKPSRASAEALVKTLLASPEPGVQVFLEKWKNREIWLRKADGAYFLATKKGDGYALFDIVTGAEVGQATRADIDQIKPNAGVQAVVSGVLVQFQLMAGDPAIRAAALAALERAADPSQLAPLRASIDGEKDASIKARKIRLERLLTLRFATDPRERISAIESFSGDTSVDVRAVLTPLLATTRRAAAAVPADVNIAAQLHIGRDISEDEAYGLLVTAGLAPATISNDERNAALSANLREGAVGGVPRAALNSEAMRDQAYKALADQGLVPPFVPAAERAKMVASHVYLDVYTEPNFAVTSSARSTLDAINRRVLANQMADLALDALSLASIYFLAAIGLAITFGVMGVINMAHGEFIMIGAYTGYVVQRLVGNYTVSILLALPLAFFVSGFAGVVMERLVIRRLVGRPLETLLATFGISIALQQLAKLAFGTQARPLTAPDWLNGSLDFNDIIGISYIRVAIFVLAVIFLLLLIFILKRTRLGLEVRAVTQNRRMAAAMGINPGRINMLTFALGSGIAGIAGVAIGLFAQVTSELGSNYIVQSFMAVVVGGVGNIWGTLAGAALTGVVQKGIEWFNPSNTLAAQTWMVVFIIIFIQFKPRGIIALRGRAAGD
jgi:urea transport system permease protein